MSELPERLTSRRYETNVSRTRDADGARFDTENFDAINLMMLERDEMMNL